MPRVLALSSGDSVRSQELSVINRGGFRHVYFYRSPMEIPARVENSSSEVAAVVEDSDGEAPKEGRRSVPRPFLKWAGGKGQLLDELVSRIPAQFNRYFEPFLGGGALFFRLRPENALLSDVSRELINCFEVVRDSVDQLIADLEKHKHSGKHFYRVREWDRKNDFWVRSPVERASRFLYLNKTCYNGLYRVNSRGEFNVPFGDYKNPKIIDSENLLACSKVLAGAKCQTMAFDVAMAEAASGDFVYLDPPYVPLSETASFTSYARDGFTVEDQERLFDSCVALDRRGAQFMLSNSDTPWVRERYAQFNIETVKASRAINSDREKRGEITEVVVRNYR